MSVVLIGNPISPYVRKVNVLLLEKRVEFEIDPQNPFGDNPTLRAVSPLGKIPALRHDDRIVNDSSVIARYLDRVFPAPSFYPSDAWPAARAEWIEEYVDGGLIPLTGPNVFGVRVLRPLLSGKPAEASALEAAQKVVDEKLPAYFDYLDDQLGDAEYFVGDVISIADVTVASASVNLQLAGVRPDRARWPRLNAFLRRMHARDSFRRVIDPVVQSIGKSWVDLD
ncbi:MAG: glutathione S-transferase family protein [Myxococcota bacterium]